MAKWLLRDMKVLIVDEPTRGVDVKAKSEIYKLLIKQKDEGKGVLVYSPETRELLNVCDRILIAVDGMIIGEIERGTENFTEARILEVVHSAVA
jgi:ABC-type sugar transport system ATPase subunit